MKNPSISSDFPRTASVIEQSLKNGLNSGIQLYASIQSKPVIDLSCGENTPGHSLTTSTRMLWLSAGKPITAVAVLRAVERGEISLDQPIVTLLPEFQGEGTEALTIANFLDHTAGLKPIVTGFPESSWEEMVAKVCGAGLKRDRSSGANVGYDPGRTWVLLGEVLQRLDQQRSIAEILKQDILDPVGMHNSWLAYPIEEFDAAPELVGVTYTSKDGKLTANRSSQREVIVKANPASSMRGPIRELGLFYEMLLRGGQTVSGTHILEPATVAQMITRHRENQLDHSFQRIVDFGLGVIINSAKYGGGPVPYGFGQYASDESFGHGGSQSVIGMADPKRDLVITSVANGMPGDDAHNERFHLLLSAIYEDLGLSD